MKKKTFSTTVFGMTFAVGFPGDVINISFVSLFTAASIVCMSKSKLGVSGAVLTATLFTFALTLYIPYVGGVVTTLSTPGSQNIRNNISIASSLPTPRKICSLGTFRSVPNLFLIS
jgi:hypothetical protein